MKVLIACEFSGVVRDEFLKFGHDAVSCDLLPSQSDKGRHIQGDVMEVIGSERWDLMIAHPPCTYLTIAGNRAFKEQGAKRERERERMPLNSLWLCLTLLFPKYVWRIRQDTLIHTFESPIKLFIRGCSVIIL